MGRTTESRKTYMREWQKAYRKKNNALTNKHKWLSTYRKMTTDTDKAFEHYEKTTHCECCGVELIMRRDGNKGAMPGNSKCQDHCHKTNTLRGVICLNCNTTEGHCKNVDRAYAVACYMARHTPLETLIADMINGANTYGNS